ncbi:MAG: hypothetical protein ACK481_03295 [Candidatus Melainabacteria bacterium]
MQDQIIIESIFINANLKRVYFAICCILSISFFLNCKACSESTLTKPVESAQEKLFTGNFGKDLQITFIKSFSNECNKNNVVWIGTTDGLYYIETYKPSSPILVEGIKETHIKNIFFESGRYWVTSHNGLYWIDPKNTKKANRIEGLQDKIIVNFYSLKNGDLIAFDHRKKLYLVDISKNSAIPYLDLKDFNISSVSDNVCTSSNCEDDSKDLIWVSGTLDGVLKRIRKVNPEIIVDFPYLQKEVVTEIKLIGKRFWIATITNGLYVFDGSDLKQIQGLENKQISGVIDLDKYLLITTVKDGAHYIDLNSTDLNSVAIKAIEINALRGESISLFAQTDKYVWVVKDFEGGLYRINKSAPWESVNVDSMTNKKILDIFPFSGTIWLRVGQDELLGIDEELLTETVKVNILKNKTISGLKKIKKNLFFVETMKGAFVAGEDHPNTIYPINGLEEKKINAIYYKEDLIWVETYEHEIFILKLDNPFDAIPLKEMNGVNIWSISKFENNYVIGSNNGAFIIKANSLKNLSNEFINQLPEASLIPSTSNQSTTSIIKVCNQLIIGTLNGYQILNLDSL